MRTTTTWRWIDRAAVLVAGAGLALGVGTGLGGCSSWGNKKQAHAEPAQGPRVGLDALAAGEESAPRGAGEVEASTRDDLSARAEASAAALSRLFEEGGAPPPSAPGEPESPWIRTIDDASPSVRVERVDEPDQAPPPAAAVAPPERVSSPVESPEQRVTRLAGELAEALRARGEAPFADAAALAMLGAIDPAAGRTGGLGLAPPEERVIETVRVLAEGFVRGRASSGDPSDAAALLAAALSGLENAGSVRIDEARLCARVMGFGQWTPLGTSTFVAGRATPMIVYTELSGFGTREATPGEARQMGLTHAGGMRAVDLDVTLALYHAADGVLAWRRPSERVIDVSRRERRDFYVLAEIELPPSLTVGSYALKVRVHDRISGAEDETNLPITIVADASALTSAPAE